MWALGFVILAVGHLLMYLALTADARSALAALDRQFDVAALPAAQPDGGFLTGLGFHGVVWLLPLTIPPLVAVVAFAAIRFAAFRTLRRVR